MGRADNWDGRRHRARWAARAGTAGALEDREYETELKCVSFTEIEIKPTRIFEVAQAKVSWLAWADIDQIAVQVDGKFASAFRRSRRPG